MKDWPSIAEPELRARLALTDEEFFAFLRTVTVAVGARVFTEDVYRAALAYPWPRPSSSYLLTADAVQPVSDGVADALTRDRWPLLASGSNGAPARLSLKLAHLPEQERRLLVTAGELHDFDVGASAHPSMYGALPATLFPSPGTAVRTAVLWVTTAQLTALAWTELSYALGRLDGVRFVADDRDLPELDRVFAFVSRLGAHRIDGEPVALDAVAARGRRVRACSQEQLLTDVAARGFGPDATARELVVRVMESFAACAQVLAPVLRATALPFSSPHWTPYAAAAPHDGVGV